MNSTFITDDQIWRHEGEVTATTELPERRTELKWPARVQRRSEIDYFFLMFPLPIVGQILQHTNIALSQAKPNTSELTRAEFFKYLGLRLTMAVSYPPMSVPDYFKTTQEAGSTCPITNFAERFGMSRHRFQAITSALRFDTFEESNIDEVRTPTHCLTA
jgi:hypothetical protein